MDHLSEVISKSFHDSEIAKSFSCKRTKAAAVTYNVLKPNFEAEMLLDLRSCQNIKTRSPMFSVIIDETTDVTTTSTMAVVTKYYSEKSLQVKTKFLCLVELQRADAQSLFDTLAKALTDANLNIQHAIGFGADTTNVMFGEQGGIIAKIRHVNPHCMFIKCVCHSTALSVSHASKHTIPRAINQIVQEVYGYFSHSSKRQREFIEFQDFVGTDHHKLLRHYEIRWLSLHACIKRILDQWDALKLFFQAQFLEDRNISAEFLCNSLNDKIHKLYFFALDYILQIVNKLNIIFQGDFTTVHRAFKDIFEAYTCLLSCYMKANYLKTTDPLAIDPKSAVNFLPLKDIYLGVNVSTEIDRISTDVNMKPGIQTFLQRMQSFVSELGSQLKARLPLSNLFKDLQFLDPQHVVYKDFTSTISVAKRFPNIVDESSIQNVDDELRQIKFDKNVKDLLESGGSTNSTVLSVDEFWGAIGKMLDANGATKYPNIVNFAKALLSFPMSNASCERIFSKVNLTKTNIRNRFLTQHVSAIITTKEGIKEHGDCVSFIPTKEMIKHMSTKTMYTENVNEED